MEKIKLYARAKINLILDVVGKLDNGYHDLNMIMQTIDLTDKIFIKKTFNNSIKLDTNIYWLPTDEKNLVYKVAQFLKQEYNIKYGMYINLDKKIPICAGLAGGSTDAAATLIGIRNLFKLPISNEELLKIGEKFGADIPFCIKRGTYLASGIGEKLTKVSSFPYSYILIAKPYVSLSTEEVFKEFNIKNVKTKPDIEKFIYYLEKQNLEQISKNLFNALETISIEKYPVIQDLKDIMLKNGALGSLMSGSGSAVFGIFRDKRQAIIAKNSLIRSMKVKDVFLTRPFNAK